MADQMGDLVRLRDEQVAPASMMLTRAFFNDPKLTYIAPDADRRLEMGRHLFAFELRYGLRYGRVYATSPALEGVSVWVPSDRSAITFWRAMRAGVLAMRKGLGKAALNRVVAFSDMVDSYHARHFPDPHCYLFFLGVDPDFQGKGFGSRLLRPVLDGLDRTKTPCYLNTQNAANIRFYEHFGFEVAGQAKLPDSDLLHTGMIRRPLPR